MNKKLVTFLSVAVIMVFIGYIIFDSVSSDGANNEITAEVADVVIPESWTISDELTIEAGHPKAVAVSSSGNIYVGGDSFVSCFNADLEKVWNISTPYPVTSLTAYGDSVFASTMELILVINAGGTIEEEWGPFEDQAIITSVSSNKSYIAFADAGNKMVFILEKNGVVKYLIGQSGEKFIVPSPYFDVALNDANQLFVANTGHRRVETRTIDGELLSYFGEPGTAPGAFCGCCNPANFILLPDGFATSEKGINRIKILDKEGEFMEYVSSENNFTPSVPLDLASFDGKLIYGVNPDDSKLYVFSHK